MWPGGGWLHRRAGGRETGVLPQGKGLSFFFSSRRRHTILSRDWSSDVCSSDLGLTDGTQHGPGLRVCLGPSGEILLHFRRSEERRVGKECRSRWSPYH